MRFPLFLRSNISSEIPVRKNHRLHVAIHFALWLAFAVWISSLILLPGARLVASFDITAQPASSDASSMKLYLTDFAAFFNFTKTAWFGQTTVSSGLSAYSLENHLKITSDWAGRTLSHVLPFGYSPTMLWILAPLVFMPHYVAFCFFGAAGLLLVWWITHPCRCRHGVGLVSFFSPLSQACFVLGQTALFTGAGLLFLAKKTDERNSTAGPRDLLLAGIALWALTAKPPFALTAGAVFVGLRRWRPLLVAAILTTVSTLAITPLLGTGWARDYLHLIGSYDRVNAGSAFALSLFPSHMANLRAVLTINGGLPDDLSSRISSSFWVMSLACIMAIGKRRRFPEGAIWSLAILSYLLFCPHVTSTEELQIVLLLPLCVSVIRTPSWHELVFIFTVPLLPFTSPAIGIFAGNRLLLFIAKILLAMYIVCCMKRPTVDYSRSRAQIP